MDTPFLDYMKFVEHDTSVDPFDALEMASRAPSAAPAGQGRPANPAAWRSARWPDAAAATEAHRRLPSREGAGPRDVHWTPDPTRLH